MLTRRLGLDRNPLRRRTDRIEAWLRLVLVTALLLGGPYLVWRTGEKAYQAAAAEHERVVRSYPYRVNAVIQLNETVQAVYGNDIQAQQAAVPARWIGPNGTPQEGSVVAP